MNTNYENKLGRGIITVSVILLLSYSLCIACYSFILLKGSTLSDEFKELGITIPSHSYMKVAVILSIIGVFSIGLILIKKCLGIYLYFTCVIANLITHILFKGFSANILITLILPVLMAFFITKKKKAFILYANNH